MRIKREEKKGLGFPIVGKIKIGMKHPEKGYPMALDYFVASGQYAKLFNEAFGDKPSCIKIIFHSSDIDHVCNERYEIRDSAGKLISDGDGAEFRIWSKAENKYIHEAPANPTEWMQRVADRLKTEWQQVLTLRFMIPAVKGIAGLWELTTKGKETSLKNVRDSFDSVLEIAGAVVNIPFDLGIKYHVSNTPNAKKYSVLSLTANLSQASLLEVNRLLSDTGNVVKMLRAGELTEEKILQLKSGE